MTVRAYHIAFGDFLLKESKASRINQFTHQVLLTLTMIEIHYVVRISPSTVLAGNRLQITHHLFDSFTLSVTLVPV